MNAALNVLLILTGLSLFLVALYPLYRSFLTISGQRTADSFPRSGHEGPAWYKRLMDAQANAIENLPLYIAVFVAAYASGQMAVLDAVACYYLYARLAQTTIHLLGVSHWLVMLRATFWFIQIGLLAYVVLKLLGYISF